MSLDAARRQRMIERGQALSQAFLRAFHRYANWLVGISWKRFIVLAVALLVSSVILQELPPFSWRVTETVEGAARRTPTPPVPPEPSKAPVGPRGPAIKIERPASGAGKTEGLDISIDQRGIRITPRTAPASGAATAAASG